MSSFLTVLGNQASVTAHTKFGFATIIKAFYDDHAKITGIFMILKAVESYKFPCCTVEMRENLIFYTVILIVKFYQWIIFISK
jgi:hypothetical protein